jgi:hypothetical protein
MKRFGIALLAASTLLVPAAAAQDATPAILATYMRCNPSLGAQADEVVRGTLGPIVQKHVTAGHLTGWAWLDHVYGGAWRKLLSFQGTDIDAMMDARQQIYAEFGGQRHKAARDRLGAACGSHDDYLWVAVATSPANPNAAGTASMSTYHACDSSRQGRANEIFQQVLAPLYKKHTDMGHLTGWGFFAHRMGGVFRALETLRGADHKTLMNMQGVVYGEAMTTNALAMNEFREICSWHQDYLWNNITNP